MPLTDRRFTRSGQPRQRGHRAPVSLRYAQEMLSEACRYRLSKEEILALGTQRAPADPRSLRVDFPLPYTRLVILPPNSRFPSYRVQRQSLDNEIRRRRLAILYDDTDTSRSCGVARAAKVLGLKRISIEHMLSNGTLERALDDFGGVDTESLRYEWERRRHAKFLDPFIRTPNPPGWPRGAPFELWRIPGGKPNDPLAPRYGQGF